MQVLSGMSDDEGKVYEGDGGLSKRRRTGCGVKYDIVYDRHRDDERCVMRARVVMSWTL